MLRIKKRVPQGDILGPTFRQSTFPEIAALHHNLLVILGNYSAIRVAGCPSWSITVVIWLLMFTTVKSNCNINSLVSVMAINRNAYLRLANQDSFNRLGNL